MIKNPRFHRCANLESRVPYIYVQIQSFLEGSVFLKDTCFFGRFYFAARFLCGVSCRHLYGFWTICTDFLTVWMGGMFGGREEGGVHWPLIKVCAPSWDSIVKSQNLRQKHENACRKFDGVFSCLPPFWVNMKPKLSFPEPPSLISHFPSLRPFAGAPGGVVASDFILRLGLVSPLSLRESAIPSLYASVARFFLLPAAIETYFLNIFLTAVPELSPHPLSFFF